MLDASIAAAWILPDEQSTADRFLHLAAEDGATAPDLIWHELRNILLMATRRGRIAQRDVALGMSQLRRLPIETVDLSVGGDGPILDIALTNKLTAYDAAYLSLAVARDLPLATADRSLRRAAEAQGIVFL